MSGNNSKEIIAKLANHYNKVSRPQEGSLEEFEQELGLPIDSEQDIMEGAEGLYRPETAPGSPKIEQELAEKGFVSTAPLYNNTTTVIDMSQEEIDEDDIPEEEYGQQEGEYAGEGIDIDDLRGYLHPDSQLGIDEVLGVMADYIGDETISEYIQTWIDRFYQVVAINETLAQKVSEINAIVNPESLKSEVQNKFKEMTEVEDENL